MAATGCGIAAHALTGLHSANRTSANSLLQQRAV